MVVNVFVTSWQATVSFDTARLVVIRLLPAALRHLGIRSESPSPAVYDVCQSPFVSCCLVCSVWIVACHDVTRLARTLYDSMK